MKIPPAHFIILLYIILNGGCVPDDFYAEPSEQFNPKSTSNLTKSQKNKTQLELSLDEFADVIKHWRDQHPQANQTYYQLDQITNIADNILLYQRNNGGWATNNNPLRVLSIYEVNQEQHNKVLTDTSLDNRNVYPQIRYLAEVYQLTGNIEYQEAVIAGIEYILQNQYENGGWAHSPPRTDDYYGHITFADEVMSGVLTLLRDIDYGNHPFEFISKPLRQRCAAAYEKGHNLLLNLQIIVQGKATVWAGQYDKTTLRPVPARSYELAGLQSWESVAVVRYLMAEKKPDQREIDAIEAAVHWFESSAIQGLRLDKIETEPVQFKYYTSHYDLIAVSDPSAPPIWARFYDIETGQPFMANRDGTKVLALADVARERRTGYEWYGYWPRQLIEEEYPSWQDRVASSNKDR